MQAVVERALGPVRARNRELVAASKAHIASLPKDTQFYKLAIAKEDATIPEAVARAQALLDPQRLAQDRSYHMKWSSGVPAAPTAEGEGSLLRAEAQALTMTGTVKGAGLADNVRIHLHRIDDDWIQLRLKSEVLGADGQPVIAKIDSLAAGKLTFTPVGADNSMSIATARDGAIQLSTPVHGRMTTLELVPG